MQAPRSIRLWYFRVGRTRDSRLALGFGHLHLQLHLQLHRPTVACLLHELWSYTGDKFASFCPSTPRTKWPSELPNHHPLPPVPPLTAPPRAEPAIFLCHFRTCSSRMQKCRNIYVPRVSNTSKNNSMWLSCIEHCSKKAEKVARGEGHKLLVFYWMKWRAWRWFINVPKSS